MKRAIIVGATSGIGQEIAKVLLAQGWKIGIAGRRKELLTAFQERNPEQIATQALDVTQKDAVLKLNGLIEQLVLPRPTRQQNDSRISISIRLSNWHICRN